jgi:ATP/ADP translocase
MGCFVRPSQYYLLNPEDAHYSFGINLLECKHIGSQLARSASFYASFVFLSSPCVNVLGWYGRILATPFMVFIVGVLFLRDISKLITKYKF